MRSLRYSINVTLDGCCHHEAGLPPDAESMGFWADEMERADALVLGRITYGMMESAWRRPASGVWPDWVGDDDVRFAEAIDAVPKHVVSRTLTDVDWNAELLVGDPVDAVRRLKAEPGGDLWVGGVALPRTLVDAGLIDEIVLAVHPVVAGHGPTLLAGLEHRIRLDLVDRRRSRSGVDVLRYRPAHR
jgi:dihydrofolate reductase